MKLSQHALCCSLLLLSACGYIGEPEPPSLNIPNTVKDLRVAQRGATLDIRFTLPDRSTDGLLMPRLNEVYLEASGEKIDVPEPKPGQAAVVTMTAASMAGRTSTFRLRVRSHKGNWSEWSNTVEMKILAQLQPPTITATPTAAGVAIRWNSAVEIRIRRKAPGEQQPSIIATAKGGEWIDTSSRFGAAYEYAAQSFEGPSESDWSAAIAITPADTFPPAAPKGLTVIAGVTSVELAWDLSPETDIAGFRIQRAQAPSDNFTQIGETTAGPSYSDKTVSPGTTYRYRIVAFDEIGNASAPSPIVETSLP